MNSYVPPRTTQQPDTRSQQRRTSGSRFHGHASEELGEADSGAEVEISCDNEKYLFSVDENGEDVGGIGGGDAMDTGVESL